MRRAIAREQEEYRTQDRFASTLIISASIIAAVRLAREDISTPSPRVTGTNDKFPLLIDALLYPRAAALSRFVETGSSFRYRTFQVELAYCSNDRCSVGVE